MKTVLFVCVENSNRSQMAEEEFRGVSDLIEKKVQALLSSLDGFH